ncbi:unnamed protein product [Macrosiphum euphorbiae]|uniref:Huntingtin n=1 Tax=Macrosiphum euphorbiae TaxID=13131 RepID=A0AAV0XGE1_9HEMI|nr:unnamed protein product [Macrosiphum euphorbiae]
MPTPKPLPATHETTIASKIKSYANVTKHQTEKPEPTINACKLLQIIKDFLTTAQESEDVASKNAVITTVLRIINAIPTSHDE